MKRVLLTAFEPYDRWNANSSWLTLKLLAEALPPEPIITTRLYPVDYLEVKRRLTEDLQGNFDYAVHLGQAPGSANIRLETFGLNIRGVNNGFSDQCCSLVDNGPVAYRSALPLDNWALMLRRLGVPAHVSFHAGTYLCNATFYLSCYLAEKMSLCTRSAFVHLPLDCTQTASVDLASMPAALSALALRAILDQLASFDE